uniref:Sulfide:quinone oxidoreductase, mitochondrial n=1 Tax=Schistocephalus solidus TaxID=70667 RepID=A0A0X3NZX0_SCHSO
MVLLSCTPALRAVVCRMSSTQKIHHRVLIAGGGSGGIAVASKLKRLMPSFDVAIIEPSDKHYYQPSFTLVGAGLYDPSQTFIPMHQAIPRDTRWIKDSVAAFDPPANKVITATGKEVTYDYLVISMGVTLRYDLLNGALDALKEDPRVCSNYSPEYMLKSLRAFENFKTGTAVFTFPNPPIKCAGAPLKAMYLFEDYLRRRDRQKDAKILYFTPAKALFSVPKYAKCLSAICDERGIKYSLGHKVIEVNHKASQVVVENVDTKETSTFKYDLLHIVPPMTPPEVLVKTAALSDSAAPGYVTVDRATTRHIKFPNIFSIGDCSNMPTSKTAAAIASQTPVLVENLLDVLKGGAGTVAQYDGYTSCPLITGETKGILAEFNYDLQPRETLPFDQATERWIFGYIKRFILPPLYWDGLLRGIWPGPKRLRKVINPMGSD